MSEAPGTVIESWLASLPEPATVEHVRQGFWYVRLPGAARRWIPVEIELGERTVKFTSHVIVLPDSNRERVYELLLRHNHGAGGASFSIDGREGVLCLVARIPAAGLQPGLLDAATGAIVEKTETTFRSILQLGFASRMPAVSRGTSATR